MSVYRAHPSRRCRVAYAALLAAGGLAAQPARAWTAAEEGLLNLDQGRCEAAAESFNRGLQEGDPVAYLMVGFMYLKGACVKAAPEKAVPYLEAATKAGEADAARQLTMMHGFGLGVPQSYAQAGRWFVAQTDILRVKGGSIPPGTELPAANMSVEALQYVGVLASVGAALPDRLKHPIARLSTSRAAEKVSVKVHFQLGPEGLRWDLVDGAADRSIEARSVQQRSSDEPHYADLHATIEGIVKDLPPYPRPAQPVQAVVPVVYIVR